MYHVLAFAIFIVTGVAFAEADPARWVDPFIGTDNGCNCFPGPSHPFGLMQPGPDSDTSPRRSVIARTPTSSRAAPTAGRTSTTGRRT